MIDAEDEAYQVLEEAFDPNTPTKVVNPLHPRK